MSGRRIEIGVLGRSTLAVDGVPAQLSSRRMRRLLAALVLGPGSSVTSARLIEAVWDGRPTAGATNTLQGYVSRLRRLAEAAPASAGADAFIRHTAGHYVVALGDAAVDVHRFDTSLMAAQNFLSVLGDPIRPEVSNQPDRVEVQRERLDRALASWRGEPYEDLGDDARAVAARRRLAERRVDGQTALLVMDLMMGRAAQAASALEELVGAHPLREQLWQLWAVALVRSNRGADAVDALGRLRLLLSTEIGIEPSPAVASLQAAILRQDPALLGNPRRPGSRPVRDGEVRRPRPDPRPIPLRGRDREVRLLQEALSETTEGRGRHAVVVGAPGMGKSRLLAEVRDWGARHHPVTTVTFRGSAHAVAPPMWSLARAADDLSRTTGIAAPPLLREPATANPFGCAAQFADYVRDLTRHRPLMLVVEDLHCIDGPTTSALTHLAEHAVDLPVMLLVSRRPGVLADESDDLAVAIARAGGLWLELSGLDADDTRRLAGDLPTARPLSGPAAERLRARTDGNPLHLRVLLEHEVDDVPPAVVALVRAELRALPPVAVEVLLPAAAVGLSFPADAVRLGLPYDGMQIEVALEAARRSGLVRHDADGWRFSSPVVHESVLAVVSHRAQPTVPPT